ncbi:MAG TPA: hypothetical protein VKA64_07015 [Gammaproteobacteria bacterium]|nr:hypothetical protein [Gammaproteobacteria bacterium]
MLHALVKGLDTNRLAFLALTLGAAAVMRVASPDFYWHLEAGEYIVRNLTLPQTDPFSYTNEGRPWVAHEWLFQTILYGIHHFFGTFGVALLTAGASFLSAYLVYSAAGHVLPGRVPRMALAVAILLGLLPTALPRPQLATFVFFALFLSFLFAAKYRAEPRRLLLAPPIMVLWVNMHGGYVLGLVLLFLFLVLEAWTLRHRLQEPAPRRHLTWLGGTAVAALLASAANPDFVSHWLYPFQVMGMEATKRYISEWQSPNFQMLWGKWYLLLAIAFFAAQAFRSRRPDATEFFVPAALLAAGFISMRHVPLAALTWLPFTAAALSGGPASRPLFPRLQASWERYRKKGRELGALEYRLNWLLLVVLVVLLAAYRTTLAPHRSRVAEIMPVAATDFLIREGIEGRMFNTYSFGGYLLHRLYPDQKVFIDGRADMYGDEFIRDYVTIGSARPGWARLMDEYRIDYVLCRPQAAIQQVLLERGDFALVYSDEIASVLLRRDARFQGVINRYTSDGDVAGLRADSG